MPLLPTYFILQAFSAFFFVMDFLNLTSGTLDEAKLKLKRYCSTPWKEVRCLCVTLSILMDLMSKRELVCVF